MLSVAHTLISVPFGIYLQNPFLIFISAALTHFLADTLLHWNIYPYKFKRYPFELVALDILSGLALAWLLLGDLFISVPILIAIAGGNAPDVVHGLWDFMSKKTQRRYFSWATPFFSFHDKLQRETTSMWRGIVSQVVVGAIAVLLIFLAR